MASNSISKSVIWQTIGKMSVQGLSFFTAPIFTRLLSTTDYGYTTIYASWASLISLFIGVQTYGSINNARIKYKEDEIDGYLSSIMTISVLLFLFILLIAVIFQNSISRLLGFRKDIYYLLFFFSFFTFIISFYTAKLDAYKKAEKSCFLSVGLSVSIIILSLIFVLNTKSEKYIAKLYAQAIPYTIMGFILIWHVYKKGRMLWNTEYIKFCLAFTLPMVIHSLGHIVFSQSDRVMLQKLQSESIVGIYGITYTLCSILNIIIDSLNVSWVPFYYEFKKQKDDESIIKHSRRYIKLVSFVFIGFHLLSYDVFKILAPKEYWPGMIIIPLFVISFYFMYLYLFPINFEFFHCKTKIIPIITFSVAIINIIINFILIPKYGLLGAAIGTTTAHVLLFVLHQLFTCIFIKQKYEYKIQNFVFWIVIICVSTIIIYILKNIFIIRWIIALLIGIYLLFDIIKNKSIF